MQRDPSNAFWVFFFGRGKENEKEKNPTIVQMRTDPPYLVILQLSVELQILIVPDEKMQRKRFLRHCGPLVNATAMIAIRFLQPTDCSDTGLEQGAGLAS